MFVLQKKLEVVFLTFFYAGGAPVRRQNTCCAVHALTTHDGSHFYTFCL